MQALEEGKAIWREDRVATREPARNDADDVDACR